MTDTVIARHVLDGSCDRCGYAASLAMTEDEHGHRALLCKHCIASANKTQE